MERSRRLSSLKYQFKTQEWASRKRIKESSLSSLVLLRKQNRRTPVVSVSVSWFLTSLSMNSEVNLTSILKKELVQHSLLPSSLKLKKTWRRNLNQQTGIGMLIAIIWISIGFQLIRIATRLNMLQSKKMMRRKWITKTRSNLSLLVLKFKMKTPFLAWILTWFNPVITMKQVKNHWSPSLLQSTTTNNEFSSLMINNSISKLSSSFLSMVLALILKSIVTFALMASKP